MKLFVTFLIFSLIIFSFNLFCQDNRVVLNTSKELPDMRIIDITKKNVGVFLSGDSLEDSKQTPKLELSIVDTMKGPATFSNLLKIKNGAVEKFETPQVESSLLIFYEKDKQRGGLVVEDGSSIKLFNRDGYEIFDRLNERGRLKIMHFLAFYKGTAIELPCIKLNSKDISNNDTINKNFVIMLISRDLNRDIHHTFIFPKDPIRSDDYYYSTNLLSAMLTQYLRVKNLSMVSCLLIPGILNSKKSSNANWKINNTAIMSKNNESNEINLNYYFW